MLRCLRQRVGLPRIAAFPTGACPMQLGAFSVSLAVKDLTTSRAFYEALGFSVTGGDAAQNWLVLRNNGIARTARADPDGEGPAYLQLTDPDGNVILIDQHVARPTGR